MLCQIKTFNIRVFFKRRPNYNNVMKICVTSTVENIAKYDYHQAHEGGKCRREFERHYC